MKEVVKKEVLKLLDVGVIYPIADSKWVSPTQVVPKKSGVTVVANGNNELIPTRVTSGWRVCIDYRKLNAGTRKDHFPIPFVDQMLERVAGHGFYCFLDGYSWYSQIGIALEDHTSPINPVLSLTERFDAFWDETQEHRVLVTQDMEALCADMRTVLANQAIILQQQQSMQAQIAQLLAFHQPPPPPPQ